MQEILFIVAMVLLGAGAALGGRIERGHRINQPLNKMPLDVVTSISGLAGIAWFIYGFFQFSWWLPLVAMVAFVFPGAYIIVYAQRNHFAALWAMLISLVGIAVAIYVLVTDA